MLIQSVRITIAFVFLSCYLVLGQGFKEQQLKNSRVKKAYQNKWASIESELKNKGVNSSDLEVFIRVFKHEQELELWVKNKSAQQFTLYKKLLFVLRVATWVQKENKATCKCRKEFMMFRFLIPAAAIT